ncbi:tRNA (adenosine(37)-N6)-threonylcarbamoyltransferase complex transferase subunit TsaD, partial [Streptococcus suis]
FIIPTLRLCVVNAVMVDLAAFSEYNKDNTAGWDLNANPSLAFENL